MHGHEAGQPDGGHAGVGGEDRVVARAGVHRCGQRLGAHVVVAIVQDAAQAAEQAVVVVGVGQALLVGGPPFEAVPGGLEVRTVPRRHEMREKCAQGGCGVTGQAHVDGRPAAEVAFQEVDLEDLAVGGVPVAVGEVRAEHDQGVAGVQCLDGGGVADEAGLSDLVGVVVLEALLGLEGEDHRCGQALGEFQHLCTGVAGALADQQGDPVGGVDKVGGLPDSGVVGPGDGTGTREAGGPVVGQFPVTEVPGDGEDRHPAFADRGAHGALQHPRQLVHRGDRGPEDRDVPEQHVVVDFLEVVAAHLGGGDLSGDGEYRGAALGRVVEAVEQVHRSRADGAHAHTEGSGQLGLGTGRERGGLLVTAAYPVETVGGADGIGQRVQGVADDAEDVAHAQLLQGIDDHAGDGTCHGKSLRSVRQ